MLVFDNGAMSGIVGTEVDNNVSPEELVFEQDVSCHLGQAIGDARYLTVYSRYHGTKTAPVKTDLTARSTSTTAPVSHYDESTITSSPVVSTARISPTAPTTSTPAPTSTSAPVTEPVSTARAPAPTTTSTPTPISTSSVVTSPTLTMPTPTTVSSPAPVAAQYYNAPPPAPSVPTGGGAQVSVPGSILKEGNGPGTAKDAALSAGKGIMLALLVLGGIKLAGK